MIVERQMTQKFDLLRMEYNIYPHIYRNRIFLSFDVDKLLSYATFRLDNIIYRIINLDKDYHVQNQINLTKKIFYKTGWKDIEHFSTALTQTLHAICITEHVIFNSILFSNCKITFFTWQKRYTFPIYRGIFIIDNIKGFCSIIF